MTTRTVRRTRHVQHLFLGCAAVAAGAPTAAAQVKNWNSGDGLWSAGGLWTPVGQPGLLSPIFVGNMLAAENATVTLDVDALGQSLAVTDGMEVATGSHLLFVTGPTTVSGLNVEGAVWHHSTLRVEDGPGAIDAIVGSLTLSNQGKAKLQHGHLVVNGLLDIELGSRLEATGGQLTLAGNGLVALRADGDIALGAYELVIDQNGAGRIDLDGGADGGDHFDLSYWAPPSNFSRLTINGTGLLDSMDDDVVMNRGNVLTMNLSEGWTLGPGAKIWLGSGPDDHAPTLVAGQHLSLAGGIRAYSGNASGRIAAPATLEPTSWILLGIGGELRFESSVVVDGVAATLEPGAQLRFDGATTLLGGSFSTHGASIADGYVEFNGPTSYQGAVTLDGFARQDGAATVAGATTIDAGRFDIDGTAGTTVWTISDSLVVNAEGLDTSSNDFGGAIAISGGALGKLTVNLADPAGRWTLDAPATLTLGGVFSLMTTRLAGSPLDVEGTVEVTNAVRIQADTRVRTGALVEFQSPTSRLRFSGQSRVDAGASFSGEGRLENQADGTMTLSPGADLGATDLLNAGTLRIAPLSGPGAGLAMADRAIFEPTSTWRIQIGGAVGGVEHDLLQLSGSPSTLAGVLDVDLIDAGGMGAGLFLPEIGDSFVVLLAPTASLTGAFLDDPISHVPNNAYIWSVSTESDGAGDRLRLAVANIVPCPGDLEGDGVVDGADLGLLLGSWGPCDACVADLTLDGVVDGGDLGILLGAWGGCSVP